MSGRARPTVMALSLLTALAFLTPAVSAADPSPTPAPRPAPQPGEPWIVYQAGTVPGGATPLHLVRPDGSGDHVLVSAAPGADPAHPAWSPDGDSIAYDVFNGTDEPRPVEIWVVDADGANSRRLAACELPCLQLAYPAWSPDGAEIALSRYDILPSGTWGPSAVEVLDIASGVRRVVAETPDGSSAYYSPRWSPDGRSIVLVIETYPDASQSDLLSSSIAVVPSDGSGPVPRVITPSGMAVGEPDWAPADRIVFRRSGSAGDPLDDPTVMSMLGDGSDIRTVIAPNDALGYAIEATWNPDGSGIMFGTGDASGAQWVAYVRPDGTGLEQAGWHLATPADGVQRTHAHLRPTSTPLGLERSPSASPSRSATSGWTYLALGDSNVYGPAEACGSCTSYPRLLTDRITTELAIPVRLIDGSQWNRLSSGRLLEEITDDSWGEAYETPRDPSLSPREAIGAADLITITVAANDQPWFQDPDPCGGVYDEACIDKVVKPYQQNLEGILAEIQEIRAGRPTAVRVTTLYNDLIAGPGYDPTWYYSPEFLAASTTSATALLDALNVAMRESAEDNGAVIVDMHGVANGADGSSAIPAGWFSKDYGDLNQAGQEAFADEMMRVGFAPLVAPGD